MVEIELSLALRQLSSRPFPESTLSSLATRNILNLVKQSEVVNLQISFDTGKGLRKLIAAKIARDRLGLSVNPQELLPHYVFTLVSKA